MSAPLSPIAHELCEELDRLRAINAELLAAAETVLAGLLARFDAAPVTAKPVFDGIASLHSAIRKAKGETP